MCAYRQTAFFSLLAMAGLVACWGRGGFDGNGASELGLETAGIGAQCALDGDCRSDLFCSASRCTSASSIPPCVPGSSETRCSDAIDNDCDGLVDCDDRDCLGESCAANGRLCSVVGACSCITGQTVETTCANRTDDDCDGLVDCQDPDCELEVCDGIARICSDGRCECLGSSPETECANGRDDDCDGLPDCSDPDCNCSGENCLTAEDEDGDGLAGCADPDCAGATCGVDRQCSGGGCNCVASNETSCVDGVDNDCDGLVDCEDEDCDERVCGDAGLVCLTSSCVCTAGSSPEWECDDNIDNDCDGLTDCLDPDCDGQICFPNACLCSDLICEVEISFGCVD